MKLVIPILTICVLSATSLFITTNLVRGMPLPITQSPNLKSSDSAEKFNSIRTSYFKIAENQSNPADGMLALLGIFTPDQTQEKKNTAITEHTNCIPTPSLTSNNENALYTAYCASFIAFEARDSFWPLNKFKLANRSLTFLDSAVSSAPKSIEIRALRLAVTYHLPFFFGRSKQAEHDLKLIKGQLAECQDSNSKSDGTCNVNQEIVALLKFVD